MAETWTVSPVGKEDLSLDTPGSGAAEATHPITTSTGGTQSLTKLSAATWPVLDVPVVASARSPFAAVAPSSDRDIEECLRRIRINAREAKNIEHYGAVAGTSISDADAERNTQAWRKCLDDINSEGRNNGIFFPGARYEFKEIPGGLYGTTILPFETSGGVRVANVVVVGSPGTQIVAHANANAGRPFMYATGVSNLFILDAQISHRLGAGHSTFYLDPQTNGIMSNIHFDRVSFTNGQSHLSTDYTSGANYVKDLWVTNCVMNVAASYGLSLEDVAGAKINGNVFAGASAGIRLNAQGTVAWGNYEVMDNRLVNGIVQDINVTTAGATFTPAIHNTVKIVGNKISLGTISVQDVNDLTVEGNTLFDGVMTVTYSANATSAYDLRIHRNTITGGTIPIFSAITLSCSSTNLRRWWITENDLYKAARHGIHISPAGSGRLRGGEIARNMILDPAQQGHNIYSGILMDSSGAGNGTSETMVLHNRMTSTVGGLQMKRGIEEASGGQNDFNRYISNMVKGWQTGAISSLAAGSSDKINPADANSSTIDLGSPV